MAILVTCDACGVRLRFRREHAGKTARCRNCRERITVVGETVPDHDVFISHSSKDSTVADVVLAALESRGVRCWIAPRDILPGKPWAGAILDAIGDAPIMVLIFSANANSSPQVLREVDRAVSRGVIIVPFRIERAAMSKEMEYYIAGERWLEALDGPIEDHVEHLFNTVKRLLRDEGPAAAPSRRREQLRGRRTAQWIALATALVVAAGAAIAGLGLSSRGPSQHAVDRVASGNPMERPATTRSSSAPRPENISLDRGAVAGMKDRTVARLLALARSDDSPERGHEALATLEQLLTIDPSNGAALALREKINGYYAASGRVELSTQPATAPAVVLGAERQPSKIGETLTNALGMRLTYIPPGEFTMGIAAPRPSDSRDSTPLHVRVKRGFLLAIHEVTVGQFAAFVKDTGYTTEAEKSGGISEYKPAQMRFVRRESSSWRSPGFEQTDQSPVVGVTWNDANAFCDWLLRKERRMYRLPTEAEWEYACRAGTSTIYPWGDDPNGGAGFENAADLSAKERFPGWTDSFSWRDGFLYTAPVGHFRPNAWGLYDMIGNVAEWCGYGNAPSTADPAGPPTSRVRVVRGGAWYRGPDGCRIGLRFLNEPSHHSNALGFRVAMNLE